MSKDKVPTGKIARASKFLKTGVKVGANYASHFGKKAMGREVSRDDLDAANANTIFDSFSELRGSALKVAQMLSMDSVNFSSSFTNVMQKAQYSVPPMSAPLAVNAFKKSIGKAPSEVFERFNPNAVKAASMGQVHEAWIGSHKFAVKIQYPGVAESVRSDMKLVKAAATKVMRISADEITPYFQEIEDRLMEEADYTFELRNSIEFAEDCRHLPGIAFPKYYPEFSSERVLSMDWIEGVHMKEFLDTAPPQELRQAIASRIWDLYEFQIHVLKKLNADPHPGNFLFRADGTVGVLDFGCTKRLSPELYDNYFRLADPTLFHDYDRAVAALLDIEILRPTDEGEKQAYLVDLFGRLIGLIARPYHLGVFDFTDEAFSQEITDVGNEIGQLRELRGTKDFLFLNKTYYGLFGLFHDLRVCLDTTCKYHNFLRANQMQAN